MDKEKALDAALSQIEKAFGKGSIMRMGQDNAHTDIEGISTGSLGLDMALGIGGLPRGRIVEIYGPESSGKTTLALSVIAQAQKKGGTCAFIDAEHWKLPILWCARAQLMYWWLTRWLLLCPRLSWKARWGIRTWGCRRA